MPGEPVQPKRYQYSEAQAQSGLLSSNSTLRRLVNLGIDLLFPPRCSGCSRVDFSWCGFCQTELDQTPVTPKVEAIDRLHAVASTGLHSGKLQAAILGLKYDNVRSLARPLGQRLVECLAVLDWAFEIIVPVPLHPTRLTERGYNQSQLLGEYLASRCSVPCVPQALSRQRATGSQVGLNAAERQSNVSGAFRADPDLVADRNLLLIDDVCTTGATLNACAQAALEAGARAVYALTVSRAG